MDKIVIVGAGPVGCLLALRLVDRGYKVTLLERSSEDVLESTRDNGKAINLTLCDRGFKGLEGLAVAQRLKADMCACIRQMHTQRDWGGRLSAIRDKRRGSDIPCGVPISAAHFCIRCGNAMKIDLRFNHKCVGIRWSPLAVEMKNLADGNTYLEPAGRIMGADGAFSSVRSILQRSGRFNYSQEFLDQGYKEIIFPRTARAAWAQTKTALHMWPRERYMLLGFPNTDGSFTCSLHMPFEGEVAFSTLTGARKLYRSFRGFFPTW